MTVSTKIGFGAKVSGEVVVMGGKSGEEIETHDLNSQLAGKIVVALSFVGREFLEKAGFVGVAGMVVPSLHRRDFEYLTVLNEFPVLVLTKFGRVGLSAELREKLAKLNGKKALLDGDGKNLTVG